MANTLRYARFTKDALGPGERPLLKPNRLERRFLEHGAPSTRQPWEEPTAPPRTGPGRAAVSGNNGRMNYEGAKRQELRDPKRKDARGELKTPKVWEARRRALRTSSTGVLLRRPTVKRKKARRLGRNKRREAVALKHSAIPVSRDRDTCPYCGRMGGMLDPECETTRACTPSTT